MSGLTPADYASALSVLDSYATAGAAWCDEATFAAIIAVARADIAHAAAWAEYDAARWSDPQPPLAPFARACNAASDALDVARARLVALATPPATTDDGAAS